MTDASSERRVFPRHWGAEFIRASEVRFRIWAPGAESLSLRRDGADTPMTAADTPMRLIPV
jgi:1,4-alpha-glucan branching enzyme